MAISINGIDKLINKLNKLSNIEAKKIINEVVDDVEKAIINGCPEETGKSKQSVGKCDVRDYGSSCYIDVGLSNTTAPFEDWKGAWFNHWGFDYMGTGRMVNKHVMWFDEAVQSVERTTLDKVKRKVKEEVKAIKNM